MQSSDVLLDKCIHFKELMKIEDMFTLAKKSTSLTMLTYLKSQELDGVFPNLSIVLKMFLSTAVANCTGERSFSVLKRVKIYTQTTMSEEQLNTYAL